jgi:hypothetical protein
MADLLDRLKKKSVLKMLKELKTWRKSKSRKQNGNINKDTDEI